MKIRIEVDGVMYAPSLGCCKDCALYKYCADETSDISFVALCNSINDIEYNFKIDQPN